MKRLALAAFLLACALPARAEPTPAETKKALSAASSSKPDERFAQDAVLPPDFLAYIRSIGYPSPVFTNRKVLELYVLYERERPVVGRHSPAVEELLKNPPPKKRDEEPKPKEVRGLNFLGIELGAGQDPLQRENEPYLTKGIDQVLDWDIRARIALDGLGARANYRHPTGLRSLSVGFMKYWDWPAAIGLDKTRDDIYGWVKQTPDKPTGGFEIGASGAVNEHIGGRILYDTKQWTTGPRRSDVRRVTIGTGYSPLGDNPGKRWNYTLLADGIHEGGEIEQPDVHVKREGFGYNLGVAFQLALKGLAGGWTPPPPVKPQAPDGGKKLEKKPPEEKLPLLFADRVQARLTGSQTPLSSFGIKASTDISIWVFRHLKVVPGISLTYKPSLDAALPTEKTWDLGFNLGLDIKY